MAKGGLTSGAALGVTAVGLLVSACAQTPLGPTAQVMPGRGKTFEAFQNDQAVCKTFASGQVQGQAEQANNSAIGGAVLSTVIGAGLGAAVGSIGGSAGAGAAVGAASGGALGGGLGAANTGNTQMAIQQQYDIAFSQCMAAKGEQVAGYENASVAAAPVADPMVRAVQSELGRLNYLRGGADGVMGPNTSAAISRYEQANGLPVDGAPSSRLLARLQSTPTNGPTSAAAPANWVSPTAGNATATVAPQAAAPTNWVAPTPAQ